MLKPITILGEITIIVKNCFIVLQYLLSWEWQCGVNGLSLLKFELQCLYVCRHTDISNTTPTFINRTVFPDSL